jgi:hypothetical protein
MRLIVLLSILFLHAGCRNAGSRYHEAKTSHYVYFNKWAIPNEYFESWLKDEPKEVITRSYATSDSSLQEPEHQLYDEYVYQFDNQGNCIYLRTNSFSKKTEAFYSYTDSGHQLREDTLWSGQGKKATIREEKSTVLDQQSYRTQSYVHKELTETTVTRFDTNGKVTITWPPSEANTESEQRWYDANGRIVKKVEIDEGEADTTYYNRDKSGLLQSIVTNEGREEYQNNEKGDPVLQLTYMKKTLYSVTRLRYEYDMHGNWIKRFSMRRPAGNYGFDVGTLQVRKIRYK